MTREVDDDEYGLRPIILEEGEGFVKFFALGAVVIWRDLGA